MLRGIVIISSFVAVHAQSSNNGYSAAADSNFYDYSNSLINGKYSGERDSNSGGSAAYLGFGSGSGGGGSRSTGGTSQKSYSLVDDHFGSGTSTFSGFAVNSPTDGYAGHSTTHGNLGDSSYLSDGRTSYAGYTSTDNKGSGFEGYSASKGGSDSGGGSSLPLGSQYAVSGEYGVEGNRAGESNFGDYSGSASSVSGSNFGQVATDNGHSSSYAAISGHPSSFSPSAYTSPYTSSLMSSDYSFGKHRGKHASDTSAKYGSNAYSSVPEMHYVRGHRGTLYSGRAPPSGYISEAGLSDSFLKLHGGSKHGNSDYSAGYGSGTNYLSKDHGTDYLPGSYLKGNGKMIVIKGSRPSSYPTYSLQLSGTSSPIRSFASNGPAGSYKSKGPLPYRGYSPASFGQGSYVSPGFTSGNAHSNSRLGSFFSGYS